MSDTTVDKKLSETKANATNILMNNSLARSNIKNKPEGRLRPQILREFSVNYPIARSCIDYIKNKISQLDWDIVDINNEDSSPKEVSVDKVKEFFREPCGVGTDFRFLQENIMEDYMVMGTITVEKAKARGGKLLSLLPVDAGTIKLRLDSNARTPQPPEIAYEQWIRGHKVAELTTDEMIFKIRNIRPNTPFGLSPLESLIIQVQSALAGSLYNFKFFTDSNLAEGFVELPVDWSNDQVKQFQIYFDSLVAGDPRFQRKLKFMPSGIKYTPTKKPEDMSFERFELWLCMVTCATFGVPPQDLGFTMDVNRATGEVQKEVGQERAKRPAVNFLQDLFTDVVQKDLGFKNLKFVYINVDPADLEQEARIDDIRVKTGIVSVDEIRRREGLKEIGVRHYVMTSGGPVYTDKIGEVVEEVANGNREQPKEKDTDLQLAEIKQWKKCSINDLKTGVGFRQFNASFLDDYICDDIRKQLGDVTSRDDINKVFDIYTSGDYKKIFKLKKISSELQKYL